MVSKNLIGIIILMTIFTLSIVIQYHFSKRELFTNNPNSPKKKKSNDDDDEPNFSFNKHETQCLYCCKMSENKDPQKCRNNCIVNGNKCLCC
jgi:hypothetical protein